MDELAKAVKKEAIASEKEPDGFREPLDVAAEKWALHCLRAYQGEVLTRGLAISEAIGQFTAVLLDK